MADLFGDVGQDAQASRKARGPAARETRGEIVQRYGVADLRDARAHKCFRCEVSTGLGFGLPHRGERVVFACKAHFAELQ
ncbi:hypothetical protein [Methylosinus sp. LW4]|uniref:hypothetical protein n=1 Tax=Methylosinus sp. LW4 TaxID=136993 RepID=UPI000381517A|nr:hypothetical protein [Methylosinus sp. LW4]